jgi:hypothetical protein
MVNETLRCEWEYGALTLWLPERGCTVSLVAGDGFQPMVTLSEPTDADLHAMVLSLTGELARRQEAERQAREAV